MLLCSIYDMALVNPFTFKEIDVDSPFCNRIKEQADLTRYAQAGTNVVLFSPRRYGKTSLMKRVQKRLADEGYLTLFADFFGVTSARDVAFRMAKAFFEMTHRQESWFQKSICILTSFRPVLKPDDEGKISLTVEPAAVKPDGIETVDEVLGSIHELARQKNVKIQVTLDEFQEIADLKDSLSLEGIMRSRIQQQPVSYFFVGSRRRLLLDMFNQRKRPFFQSALNYELQTLPEDELTSFLADRFRSAGKACPLPVAAAIVQRARRHPYYTQKLCFFLFDMAEEKIEESQVKPAFELLLESERPAFEAILQGLAPQQIVLLRAIALEPSSSVFSVDYINRRRLGSTGGIQGALKVLGKLDLIEKDKGGAFGVVDPVFRVWLNAQAG